MGKRSSRKGSRFEREICRILTEWITGRRDPVIFWRTAGSGSQFTVRKGESPMCGDVIAVDPQGASFTDYFCIECKNRRRIPVLRNLLGGKTNLLRKWWEELEEKSAQARKNPLIIFKESNQPIYILMRNSEFRELVGWVNTPKRYAIIHLPWINGIFMGLSDFLDWVNIEVFNAIRGNK